MGDVYESMMSKILEETFNSVSANFGYIGTRVFLNDKGDVEIKVLSLNECMDIIEKVKQGENISEEYTIIEIPEELKTT